MPRAFWKGYLKLSLVSCPIVLYPVVSKTERPRFHRVHRETGRRLRQQMIEPETLAPVHAEDVVRGYEVAPSRQPTPTPSPAAPTSRERTPARSAAALRREEIQPAPSKYVEVEEQELREIEIENTHTIDIEHFVPRAGIDDRYLNAAYYAVPGDEAGQEAYAVIRDAMKARDMAALARIVLMRREHAVMVEPFGKGLLAVTLHYPYEIRDAASFFTRVEDVKIPKEMRDLALHIVDRMEGRFDPAQIEDRYKKALDQLIAAKAPAPAKTIRDAPSNARVVNLMDALRASVEAGKKPGKRSKR